MITFKELSWNNCFSYGKDNIIQLDKYELIQIEGKNGSGKSSIPIILEEDLLNFETYGLNTLWTVYHNKKQLKVNYNYEIALNLRTINISPEQIREKEVVQEKQVKDGWKYLEDEKGNEVKDTLTFQNDTALELYRMDDLYQDYEILNDFPEVRLILTQRIKAMIQTYNHDLINNNLIAH